MTIEQDIDQLKLNILRQAKHFLEEFGEFYPFGAGITSKGQVKPIGVFFGDDFPKPLTVLHNLEQAIDDDIANGKYLAVAIGVNVRTKADNSNEFIDAIEVRIAHHQYKPINVYIPYTVSPNGDYLYESEYLTDGTLNVFKK